MPKKHSLDLDDDLEELWLAYKEEHSAVFSQVANKALRQFLTDKVSKKIKKSR